MDPVESADAALDAEQQAPQSRSEKKHRTIIDAATDLFLTGGYTRTSMEDVARSARVSKQTVYMHFGNKESLLFEIVNKIMTAASEPFDHEIHHLSESNNLETDLREHAYEQLTLVMQPRPLQLRRLVIAEAVAFPQLGQIFYDNGPGLTISQLAVAFGQLHRRHLLDCPDPARAASDFNWLIMSEPINRAMLLGDDQPATSQELRQWAEQAVTTFLAAYAL